MGEFVGLGIFLQFSRARMTTRSGLGPDGNAFAIRPARWIHDPTGMNRIMVSALISALATNHLALARGLAYGRTLERAPSG
jgi:hypothetical protein